MSFFDVNPNSKFCEITLNQSIEVVQIQIIKN
jgi:hypothetical protein